MSRARSNSLRHFNFLSLLLSYTFSQSEGGVYLRTRNAGDLFNLSRPRARTKVRQVLIREMFFADYAALASHFDEAFQPLINCLAHAFNYPPKKEQHHELRH